MLELLKVDKDTPDPGPLETFVRDEEGNPTGWVREMAWMKFADNMYDALGWRPPEELNADSLQGSLTSCRTAASLRWQTDS